MSNLYSEGRRDKQLPEWVPCIYAALPSFLIKHYIRVVQQKPAAQVFPLWAQWRWPGNCPYSSFLTHLLSVRHILLKLPPSVQWAATVAAESVRYGRRYSLFMLFEPWFKYFQMFRSLFSYLCEIITSCSGQICSSIINDGSPFDPSLNEMSWEALSLEEIGWAT